MKGPEELIFAVVCIGFIAVAAVVAVVRFVQFWIGFAHGMNEAGERHVRGFGVQEVEPRVPPPSSSSESPPAATGVDPGQRISANRGQSV